ncbi:MAG: D-inositol 3-phosphate glycosyltransferase [Chlamydiae bacterium]|nr:D-inositol 3-phosphate glycosyltransferase [Chlamydiota bacterium]
MIHHAGIGTYIRNLLPHLQLHQVPLRSSIYTLKEQIEFSRKIPPCDLFWSPHFNVPLFPIKAKKRIVTIHDVYHLDHPQSFAKYTYAKMLYRKAVEASARIITVSEFSKGRILHHFPQAKEKITVIHPGADHLLHVEPKPIETPSSFFLFVGNEKPHKNLSLVRKVIPNLIVVNGSLPIENLCWLYRNAEALIFPSFYEGWGLPPLEAMSLGCPVVTSNAASIPEACQNAALYFDAKSPEDLKRALSLLPEKKEALIAKGKERSSQLTWKHAARQHAEFLL